MHASYISVALIVVAQASAHAQLAPTNGVHLESIPIPAETIPRWGSPSSSQASGMRRAAPATRIDDDLAAGGNELRPQRSVRNVVVPAAAHSDLTPVNHDVSPSSAALLLRHALEPLDNSGLRGTPMTLYTALERGGDRQQQLAIIRAYWRANGRVAEYYWAVKEAAFLGSLPQSRAESDHVLLNAARAEAEAREYETRLAALAAQYDLANASQISTAEHLPLPQDMPLVTPYRTNLEVIFANRTPPSTIARVARMLPIEHELVAARAATVNALTEALQSFQQQAGHGQGSINDLLRIHERLSQQRREFLDAVRDYNQNIAMYALSVVGAGESRQTIVATLIRSTATTRAANGPRNENIRSAFNSSRTPSRAAIHGDRAQHDVPHQEETAAPRQLNHNEASNLRPAQNWRATENPEPPSDQDVPADEPPQNRSFSPRRFSFRDEETNTQPDESPAPDTESAPESSSPNFNGPANE